VGSEEEGGCQGDAEVRHCGSGGEEAKRGRRGRWGGGGGGEWELRGMVRGGGLGG